MDEFNIVLAGVGGQGIILAAQVLGTAAVNDGFNVRVSEIMGWLSAVEQSSQMCG